MHEMGLTRDVLDTVLSEAAKANARKVCSVTLSIGYVRDIAEDVFEGLFEWLARGTVAEGAELIINRVPVMVLCHNCEALYHIEVMDAETWPCPFCGTKDYDIKTGLEFRIDDINIITKEGEDTC